MIRKIWVGILLALVLALHVPAIAGVVNFDGIDTQGLSAAIPSGYAGFTWDSHLTVINNEAYNSLNNNNVAFPSASNAAQTAGFFPIVVTGGPFNLEGASFSTYAMFDNYMDNSATSLTVTGYQGANPVGSVTFDLTTVFVYQHLGFTNIDRVEFAPVGLAKWWLMDNMTTSAVPLPSALILLGSGLLGLGAAGLRRRKKG